MTAKVKDLGELRLLERLQPFCPPGMIDDDAAIVEPETGQAIVVTTDVLVDGVHFSDRTTSPFDVGWRATAANLSDLAAMGATPLGITIGLSLPGDQSVAWVEALYQGIAACLEQNGGVIFGGDVCRSAVTGIAITAIGQVLPARTLRRSAAQPGQAILATGVHGASRAGLELLLHPAAQEGLSEEASVAFIQAHQRPRPRFDVLEALWHLLPEFGLDQADGQIAGMDTSDGLANAVWQICRVSGVGAKIERSQIPTPPEFSSWLSPQQRLEWSLYGGEDFELVLCLPPDLAAALAADLGQGAAVIGSVTADPGVILHDSSRQQADELLDLQRSFQHF